MKAIYIILYIAKHKKQIDFSVLGGHNYDGYEVCRKQMAGEMGKIQIK